MAVFDKKVQVHFVEKDLHFPYWPPWYAPMAVSSIAI